MNRAELAAPAVLAGILAFHIACVAGPASSPTTPSQTADVAVTVSSPSTTSGLARSFVEPAPLEEELPAQLETSLQAKPPKGAVVGCKGGGYATSSIGCTKGVQCRIATCYKIYQNDVVACDKKYPDKKKRGANSPWARCHQAARNFNSRTCAKLKVCPK